MSNIYFRFCVVCAFTSNQQLEEGITELPDNLKTGKQDTVTYLNSTTKQAEHLLHQNYEEFAEVFQNTINSTYILYEPMIHSLVTY